MRKTPFVLLFVALLGFATFAHAQTNIIDYQGYAWETGGFLPSNPGDILNFVAVADNIDAIFGVDIFTEEATIWVTGLQSTGQVPIGAGIYAISYVGGTIEVWEDPAQDHDYGTFPPNGTAPSTFTNGTLLLGGFFNDFVLFFDSNSGTGSYEGNVTWNAGSALAAIQGIQADGFTFGGVLNDAAAVGSVPDGYDLQVDGIIEVEVVIAVEERTWSGVKGLYR